MPKIKTSRAAAKRFKTTGTGKIVRNKAYKSQHSFEQQSERCITGGRSNKRSGSGVNYVGAVAVQYG